MFSVESRLRERIKELSALHQMAGYLRRDELSINEALSAVVKMIPPSWQYPDVCAARITYGRREYKTYNFRETQWKQKKEFVTADGTSGSIEVCYLYSKPSIDEGPFLHEERELIDSLSEMIGTFIQRQKDRESLLTAKSKLEDEVINRTRELQSTVEALKIEVNDHIKTKHQILEYQSELQKLTLDLSLAEEREKQAFASDLHDHIGQGLAFIKIKLNALKEKFLFTNIEEEFNQILDLVSRTIHSTRTLTFDISPPILYELGLDSALHWLVERYTKRHKIKIDLKIQKNACKDIEETLKIIIYKFTRELLINTIKHSEATRAKIKLNKKENIIYVSVSDNGTGFPDTFDLNLVSSNGGFGLFSIRERLKYLKGDIVVQSGKQDGSVITLTIPCGEKS